MSNYRSFARYPLCNKLRDHCYCPSGGNYKTLHPRTQCDSHVDGFLKATFGFFSVCSQQYPVATSWGHILLETMHLIKGITCEHTIILHPCPSCSHHSPAIPPAQVPGTHSPDTAVQLCDFSLLKVFLGSCRHFYAFKMKIPCAINIIHDASLLKIKISIFYAFV